MTSIWDVPGSEVRIDRVGTLEPVEVLVDVDGPRLFVARTAEGEELLVVQCAEEPDRSGWLAVPTHAGVVDLVRGGEVPLLDALRQPWAWLVTQALDGTISRILRVRVDDLPAAALPEPGRTLVAPWRESRGTAAPG